MLIAGFVAVRGEAAPGGRLRGIRGAVGHRRGVGLAAFYRALAVGNMGVVAPISACAAVVPVVVGIATGDRPGAPGRRPRARACGRCARLTRGGGGRAAARTDGPAAPAWRSSPHSASAASSSRWIVRATPTWPGRCSSTAVTGVCLLLAAALVLAATDSRCGARDLPALVTIGPAGRRRERDVRARRDEGPREPGFGGGIALPAHDRRARRGRAGRAAASRSPASASPQRLWESR